MDPANICELLIKEELDDEISVEEKREISQDLSNPKQTKQTKRRLYECKFCQAQFSEKSELVAHIETSGLEHFKTRPSSSSNFSSSDKTLVKVMTFTEDSKGVSKVVYTLPFPCGICGKTFSTKAHLKRHHAIYCKSGFDWSKSLKKGGASRKVVHRDKPMSCGICGKKYSSSLPYRKHLEDHKREKPLSSTASESVQKSLDRTRARFATILESLKFNKKLPEKTSQENRRRLHREKPITCAMCGRAFSYTSVYRKHLEDHRQEKTLSTTVSESESKTEDTILGM